MLRSDAPLRGEEPEARETLLRVLREEGVTVVTGARRIAARDVPGGTRALVDRRQRDRRGAARRHRARAARRRGRPGRRRASRSRTAARASTRTCATTAHGVWALGDAIGGDHRRFQFTHVATHEGPQVAENALARRAPRAGLHVRCRGSRSQIPRSPSVGLTEAEARERGIEAHAHAKLVRELGKARATGETRGVREGRDRPRDRQAGRRNGHGGARRRHARDADDAAAHAPGRPRRRCSRRRSRTRR